MYTKKLAEKGMYVGDTKYFVSPKEFYETVTANGEDTITEAINAAREMSAARLTFDPNDKDGYMERIDHIFPLSVKEHKENAQRDFTNAKKDGSHSDSAFYADPAMVYIDGDGYIRVRALDYIYCYDKGWNGAPSDTWLCGAEEYVITTTEQAAELFGCKVWKKDAYTCLSFEDVDRDWRIATTTELALVSKTK